MAKYFTSVVNIFYTQQWLNYSVRYVIYLTVNGKDVKYNYFYICSLTYKLYIMKK